jgi:hypothetical protein
MNPLVSVIERARRRGSLKVELAVVLLVKAALLFALKELCFSHPAADHMQLPPSVVAQALLGPAAPAEGPHHDK